MNSNSVDILLKIMSNNQLTLDGVAEIFDISKRMVRNNLYTINDYLDRYGYSVDIDKNGLLRFIGDEEIVIKSLKKISYANYAPSQKERLLVMFYLLSLEGKYLTLQNIQDFLKISRSTSIADVNCLRNWLKKHMITVESRTNFGYRLEANERDIRNLLVILISDYPFETARFMNKYLKKHEGGHELLLNINKSISSFERKENRFLSMESIEMLESYILFAKVRFDNGYMLKESPKNIKNDSTSIELDFLEFSNEEKSYVNSMMSALNYMSRKTEEGSIIQTQLITRRFIEKLSDDLKIDLNNNYSFYENLSAHLSSIIDETGPAIIEVPEVLAAIRGHKLLKEMVKNNVYIIEESAHRELNEMEIAYIVIYVSLAVEELKNKLNLDILVVCDSGVATSQLLKTKIQQQFNFSKIDVASSRTIQSLREKTEYDIIFSTIKVEKGKERIIDVSRFFQNFDINEIIDIVDAVKMNVLMKNQDVKNEKQYIKESKKVQKDMDQEQQSFNKLLDELELKELPKLSDLITEDYINLQVTVNDWEEAIIASAKPMLVRNDINDLYVTTMINQVYENGPYFVIGENIAFPHGSYDQGSNKLSMSLITLKTPVPFGIEEYDPIKLVCALSPIDTKSHLRAFFTLVNLLHNDDYKQGIIQAENKKEVIRIIKKYEEEL